MATTAETSTAWYQALPKLELHAHLNGCVRDATLQRMIEAKGMSLSEEEATILTSKGARTLAECFLVFDIIHRVTTDHESITQIAEEVIQDFQDDGVVYLELRTTPKDRPEHGMSKRSYVEAVLKGIEKFRDEGSTGKGRESSIIVRLLLSIDRRMDAEQAMETVQLAASMKDEGVTGIDLSGNPRVGNWATWEPALQRARELGLYVTLHGGEVEAPDEVQKMLAFKPDRLGHMVFLQEEHEQHLMGLGIPVELCLTSNLKTCSVGSIPDHHFNRFRLSGCPVVLCTDDSGVFGTTLSLEHQLAAQAFKLTESDLKDLVKSSVDMIFADETCKERVRARVDAALAKL